VLQLADERQSEERWTAERRSGPPQGNAGNYYTLKIKDFNFRKLRLLCS